MALLTSRSMLRKGQSWNHLRPGTWTICAGVTEVCAALGARAAGYWQLDQETERLVQLGFVPGVGLDPEVGRQFAAATAAVPLSQTSLGIVAAALTGQPAVSRVEELPADSGSGRWLRLRREPIGSCTDSWRRREDSGGFLGGADRRQHPWRPTRCRADLRDTCSTERLDAALMLLDNTLSRDTSSETDREVP